MAIYEDMSMSRNNDGTATTGTRKNSVLTQNLSEKCKGAGQDSNMGSQLHKIKTKRGEHVQEPVS